MVAGSPGTHGEQTCTRLPPSRPAHICTRSDDWKLPRTRAVERTAIGLWASGGTSNMSLSLNPSAAGGTVRAAASSRSGARLPSAERRGSHFSLLAAPPAASQPSRPPQAPQPSQPSRPSLEQSFQGPRPGSGLRSRPSSRPTSAQRGAHQRSGSQLRRGVSAGRLLLHESISLRSLSSGRENFTGMGTGRADDRVDVLANSRSLRAVPVASRQPRLSRPALRPAPTAASCEEGKRPPSRLSLLADASEIDLSSLLQIEPSSLHQLTQAFPPPEAAEAVNRLPTSTQDPLTCYTHHGAQQCSPRVVRALLFTPHL